MNEQVLLALEVVGEVHHIGLEVALLVLLRQAHVPLRVRRVFWLCVCVFVYSRVSY